MKTCYQFSCQTFYTALYLNTANTSSKLAEVNVSPQSDHTVYYNLYAFLHKDQACDFTMANLSKVSPQINQSAQQLVHF